ncbi:MAG TPA: protein kinase, partial [Polyangium sp.]|nr:protein kinase [Polyangium sp.]
LSHQIACTVEHRLAWRCSLNHPNIVRYVTHGITSKGEPYLAMEWLEGMSLAERLSYQALTIEESVEITGCVARALAAAHTHGIIHRDIKPSNVFLPNGSLAQAKLIDFGIAGVEYATARLTGTGTFLGTPGYMAPEQARGNKAPVDARADIFSLGCVLYECLTGKPAFQASRLMALLAKLLMEDAPKVSSHVPNVPEFLDELCAAMLSKDPALRPADGRSVVVALDQAGHERVPKHRIAGTTLTDTEMQVVSVIAIATTEADTAGTSPESTCLFMASPELLHKVHSIVRPFGANVEELANGTLVVLLRGTGPATDQASMAARCALRIQKLLPLSPIVLLSGRSSSTERLPVGEILENAAILLDELYADRAGQRSERWIRIDDATRALLDVRFDVAEHNGGLELRGERDVGSGARRLLGKPSPFVGRDRELRHLLEFIEGSIEDSRSGVVLVTGPAGMGKSRLRYECVRTLEETAPHIAVSIARGESIGAGSTFAMLAFALRGAMGISTGESVEEQRRKLSLGVARYVDEKDRRRVATFLGEMVGAPFSDDDDPRLRAARQDASSMASRIEHAYVDFVKAVTTVSPALLVLEDLHWGDGPSLRLINAALRELHDKPFVVVAFARPEVHTLFPEIWKERGDRRFA